MLDFKISILFFSQSAFFMTFHIFYTVKQVVKSLVYTFQADVCFFLFVYVSQTLSATLIFSALKPFQGWSFIVFVKRETRSK